MNPVINRLKENGLDFSSYLPQEVVDRQFSDAIKTLPVHNFRSLVKQHQVMQLEYSILCHQLVTRLTPQDDYKVDNIKEELVVALMLAELLEHLYLYYLNVPREVEQLRKHQKIYRGILSQLGLNPSHNRMPQLQNMGAGLSLSQQIRGLTLESNWYRLLLIRSKRVLNVIETFEACTPGYKEFVKQLDKYANPVIAFLGWLFFMPRLFTNLVLLFKHTIPWSSMSDEEKSLGWQTRLIAQLERRWFELGNDVVWITVGFINCFLLTGALSPLAIYLTVTFYAYDIILALIRAAIELIRISDLKHDYTCLLNSEPDEGKQKETEHFIDCLNHRMYFEMMRLGMHVAQTTAIFLATCFAIPAFAVNPIIPLIGAVWMVAICLVGFIFTRVLENYRPQDNVEKAPGLLSFGLFAKNTTVKKDFRQDINHEVVTESVLDNNLLLV